MIFWNLNEVLEWNLILFSEVALSLIFLSKNNKKNTSEFL